MTDPPLSPRWTWRFTVYGGLFDIDSIKKSLRAHFDTDDDQRRASGQTALFAFTVDQAGFLVGNSAALSSSAWALGRLRRSGEIPRDWLDGFAAEERSFASKLNLLAPTSTDAAPVSRLGNAARRIGEHTKDAAVEAVGAGAKATGAAVTAAAAAAVTVAAGPVLGGIAGAAAGTFVEKLLTPGRKKAAAANADGRPSRSGTMSAQLPDFDLSATALHTFVAEMSEALGVAELLYPRGIRIECVRVPVKNIENAADRPLLSSFIAEDLATVTSGVARGNLGAGLAGYLTDGRVLAGRGRIDVREHEQSVLDAVAPARQPPGRWPGDISKPLVLSQQFAVNQITAELCRSAGVFAVNGPPGTGKTTLLRDVIAAVLVNRARTLTRLTRPDDAFIAEVERVTVAERYPTPVRGINPNLTGSEILLATASNKAAANVTAEIPDIKAVGGAHTQAAEADYFPDLASRVLDAEAWGLLAATLGSRKNCAAFVKRFWWNGESQQTSTDPSLATGMDEILRTARDNPGGVEDWSTAVARFRAAEADVERLVAERDTVAAAVRERPRYARRLDEIEEQLHLLTRRASKLREAIATAEQDFADAQANRDAATAAYQEHRADRPGFWVSLSTWFRAGREWDTEHRQLKADQEDAETANRALLSQRDQRVEEYAAITDEFRSLTSQRDHAQSALSAITSTLTDARQRWPNCLPDLADYGPDRDAVQLCTPWADPTFTAARNRVTLEALRVHKAFILGAANQIRRNLRVAMAVLDEDLKISDEVLRTVWQTLFLVVPVVSTTFASLPRLFGRLGPESFGWLFIDEAGQASPQQAVGGMWRARRTVVVGDPQQLEPIVPLPVPAQRSLLKRYAVAEEWLPSVTSVQRVADRLNTYGTDPIGDGSTWVGAPLRVHRRCDRPMFDVANRIAYEGLMVFGTPERSPYPGQNQWIDVPTGHAEGNWVPQEGEALKRLLRTLVDSAVNPGSIRIISPFRDVVIGAERAARTTLGEQFAKDNVGTIHTVQGQESDIVIIVLGSAPEREGARRWAAEKPNLLNVAVSRAKRRLYVVGDRSRWQAEQYFSVLSAALPSGTGSH